MKKCPKCGKENEDEARYCYNCGEVLKKDDGRPSLDDYLPHDSSGAAINPNGERIIEKDDDEDKDEGEEESTPRNDEFPEDKKQANFSNNGAPFYDNETGLSDNEMRENAERENEGKALGIASICTFYLGPIGLILGLIGLFTAHEKEARTVCVVGVILSAIATIVLFCLSSFILKDYIEYLSNFAKNSSSLSK